MPPDHPPPHPLATNSCLWHELSSAAPPGPLPLVEIALHCRCNSSFLNALGTFLLLIRKLPAIWGPLLQGTWRSIAQLSLLGAQSLVSNLSSTEDTLLGYQRQLVLSGHSHNLTNESWIQKSVNKNKTKKKHDHNLWNLSFLNFSLFIVSLRDGQNWIVMNVVS